MVCDVMIVDKDVRVVVAWRRGGVVDGDDCGWLCVLKEVLGVQVEYGGVVQIVVGVAGKM